MASSSPVSPSSPTPPSSIATHSIAATLQRTSLTPRDLSSSANHERHRLLATADLGEGAPRRISVDDDFEDLWGAVAVITALLGVVCVAFLLWPIVSYDENRAVVVGGGEEVLVPIDARDFEHVSVAADWLSWIPRATANREQLLFQDNSEQEENLDAPSASIRVFYNNPAAIPSNSTYNRTLPIKLLNTDKDYSFSAVSWHIIEGGNVTVTWDFEGGQPDFLVLQSQTAFDIWIQDAFPPTAFQVYHEYSTASGSYTLSNLPTDTYYFIFSAPSYYWPSFEANGHANYSLNLMQYETTSITPDTPSVVQACEIPLPPIPSLSPAPHPVWNTIKKVYSLLTFTTLPKLSTPAPPFTITQLCQIPLPLPFYIPTVYILLSSPSPLPPLSGGTGSGNRPSSSSPYDNHGTIDPLTSVLFSIHPTYRPSRGPSAVVFFIWAFCAVIGLFVGVALSIFLVVWVVGLLVTWIRRAFGFEDERGSDDGDDEGTEPLPVYQPVSRHILDGNGEEEGEGQLPPPEYSSVDPLVVRESERGRESREEDVGMIGMDGSVLLERSSLLESEEREPVRGDELSQFEQDEDAGTNNGEGSNEEIEIEVR